MTDTKTNNHWVTSYLEFPFRATIKTHKGHEGETLHQGSILKDGVKVGTYSEGDWGGPGMVETNNTELLTFIKQHDSILIQGIKLPYDDDLFIDEMLDVTTFFNTIEKNKAKGRIAWVLPTYPKGQYSMWSYKDLQQTEETLCKKILSKYPTAIFL